MKKSIVPSYAARNRRHACGCRLVSLLSAGFVLAGCGGGGSKGTTVATNNPGSSGNGVETTYGDFTTRVVGPAQSPVVSISGGISVTGVSGASFTTIYQNRSVESLSLNNTRIAYLASDGNSNYQIYTIPITGGASTGVTSDPSSKVSFCWNPTGTRFAYSAKDAAGIYQIFTIPATGGTPTQITQGGRDKYVKSYSPDGTKLAFHGPDAAHTYQIFTVPATGGTPTQLTTGSFSKTQPVFSPAGTQIAYVAPDESLVFRIFVLPAAGGTPVPVTDTNSDADSPAWTPDGKQIVYVAPGSVTPGSPKTSQIFVVSAFGGPANQVTHVSLPLFSPTLSPDEAQLAFLGQVGDPLAWQIYTAPIGADFAQSQPASQITNWTTSSHFSPLWSPFSNSGITLIGTGGTLGTGAAGFVYSHNGKSVRSVLAFDTAAATAASRGAARVASLTATESSSSTLLFSITSGDSLSRLAYINYNNADQPNKPVNVFLGTGITGALVHYDVSTGSVSTVLPYAANRSIGSRAPQVRREGGVFVITGDFTGVYDASGQNHARQGAHTVRLDVTTGKLLVAE